MSILRRGETAFWHWCPACEREHPIPLYRWTFNENLSAPTFTPSLNQTFVKWSEGIDANGRGRGNHLNLSCHYFITDGKLQFCPDSWHGRSDIVVMPPLPEPKDRFGHETQD